MLSVVNHYNILKFLLICLLCVTNNNNCEVSADNDSFVFPNDRTLNQFDNCTTHKNVTSYCHEDAHCVFDEDLIPENLCSFEGHKAYYCCDDFKKVYGLRPIDQICEFYLPRGKPRRQFVVGGTLALTDQHPHMAALGWNNSDGEISWRCGASVITTNFLITAAHCASYQGKPPSIARSKVLNLTQEYFSPNNHNIEEVFVHPLYQEDKVYHDIALMKFSPDYELGDFSRPACIWFQPGIPKRNLTVMGYGTLSFAGPQANRLYEAKVELQSNEICARKIPPSPNLPDGPIQQQLCAQDPKGLTDTCQGDSGGPIQVQYEVGRSNRAMIVGITSFGYNCAGSSPGIYTRVSEYVDWMEPILMSDFHNTTEIRDILDAV